jgi:hypothetical protein
MYAVIKESKVICIADSMPCQDDLATRGEIGAICEAEVTIGYTYDGTKFTPPIPLEPIAPTQESLLESIRVRRDSLLLQSDRYMLSDYPLPEGVSREQWTQRVLTYRQALRDMPETCDVNNPAYPKL